MRKAQEHLSLCPWLSALTWMTSTAETNIRKLAAAYFDMRGGTGKQLARHTVAEGLVLIEQGKPKIEAAMAIYSKLEGESQETIVDAFIAGATLTEKGALTYWYNCRRKLSKIRLLKSVGTSTK